MVAGAAAGLSTNAFSKVFFLLHEKSSSMNIEQLFKHCHRDLKNTHRLIILFLRDIKVNPKKMREKSKLEKPCLCSAMAIRRQRNVVVSNPTWHVGLKSFQAMQSWYFTTKNNKIYNSINSFFSDFKSYTEKRPKSVFIAHSGALGRTKIFLVTCLTQHILFRMVRTTSCSSVRRPAQKPKKGSCLNFSDC